MSSCSDHVGKFGEDIVASYLRSIRCEVDHISKKYVSHDYDMEVIYKGKKYCVEVKTKQGRVKYYDTGIDSADHRKYKMFYKKHGLDVFIIFVDFYLGEAYGNFFSVLDEIKEDEFDEKGNLINYDPYPKLENKIAYYCMDKMIHKIFTLSNSEIAEIGRFSEKFEGCDYSEFFKILKSEGLENVVW